MALNYTYPEQTPLRGTGCWKGREGEPPPSRRYEHLTGPCTAGDARNRDEGRRGSLHHSSTVATGPRYVNCQFGVQMITAPEAALGLLYETVGKVTKIIVPRMF